MKRWLLKKQSCGISNKDKNRILFNSERVRIIKERIRETVK